MYPALNPTARPDLAQALAHPILVVGGDGFLGSHIIDQLLAFASTGTRIHVLDLQQRYPDRDHVTYHIGSLLDHDFIARTLADNAITTVIHTASPPHGKSRDFYWAVNVEGTRTLVQACLKSGVRRLVYTSSASVVFNGASVYNANEDLLYCKSPLDAYTETKAAAEDLVLKSNNLPTTPGHPLLTVAIRPSGIFGPRDGQAIPGFLDALATGKSHMVIGDGTNLCSFTYVENVAYAHLLAAAALTTATAPAAGAAFFVTNAETIPFWDFPKRLIRALLPADDPRAVNASSRHIPRWLLLPVAYIVAGLAALVNLAGFHWDPLFTPLRIRLTTATRTFDCSRARAVLGYEPKISMTEGIERSVQWIKSVDRWRSLWAGEKITTLSFGGSGKGDDDDAAPTTDAFEMVEKPVAVALAASEGSIKRRAVAGRDE
ncbi:3-beta hydroxysteroid dehydrogenase/isomerase family-domain-containing protein [Blastocladiella britannica]|nr:3-beta hydroxysteroid dehydrogenase/isomerase family-domain-containing protein [Blastocladiella britannica]